MHTNQKFTLGRICSSKIIILTSSTEVEPRKAAVMVRETEVGRKGLLGTVDWVEIHWHVPRWTGSEAEGPVAGCTAFWATFYEMHLSLSCCAALLVTFWALWRKDNVWHVHNLNLEPQHYQSELLRGALVLPDTPTVPPKEWEARCYVMCTCP